jgi:hypothetical protein
VLPEGGRRGGPPLPWSSLLLRPHRTVASAPHAPTDARGDHARKLLAEWNADGYQDPNC